MRRHGERNSEVLVALGQRPQGTSLSEIAAALSAPLSSVQRAVSSLSGGGFLRSEDGRAATHRLNPDHPAAEALAEFSLRVLPVERSADIVLRANPAVEFAGRDREGYLVVLSPFAEPVDIARLQATLDRINHGRPDAHQVRILERS